MVEIEDDSDHLPISTLSRSEITVAEVTDQQKLTNLRLCIILRLDDLPGYSESQFHVGLPWE